MSNPRRLDVVTINADDLIVGPDGSYEYENRPFSGIAREYTREGALVGEIEYRDGLQEGRSRYWYPSGQLRGEELFQRNSRMGLSREWFESGTPKRETVFEHSIRLRDKEWDSDGNLTRDYVLTEDKPLFRTLQDYRRMYRDETKT